MAGRLEGKVCVITGSASGIGAASALRFGEEGATVVGLDTAPHTTGALTIEVDVTEPHALERSQGKAKRIEDHR